MNERNEKALTNLIQKIRDDNRYEWPIAPDDMARALVRLGVLVPSALTNEQVVQLASVSDGGYYTDNDATAAVLAELERIAKGTVGGDA